MKIYTYLAILVLVSVAAQDEEQPEAHHDHYKHLDIDYVMKEATRLAYMDKAYIVKLIEDNSAGIRRIIHNRDLIIKHAESPEAAKEAWKEEFESKYADDFDKTLIATNVCRLKFGEIPECQAYIDWDHHFDTRDEVLRKEFLNEVHYAIRQAFYEVKGYGKMDL